MSKLIPVNDLPNLDINFSDLNQHQIKTIVQEGSLYVLRKDINSILKVKHTEQQSNLPDLNLLFLEAVNNWYSSHLHLFDDYKDEIKKVSLHSDKSIELIKAEDKFQLKRPEGLKANEKKMESYVSSIGQIRFEDYYQFNDPSVFDLKYKEATIELKNGLVYKLELAKKKKDHYLKVSALLDEMPQHFTVSQSDGPDKLQGIEDVVKAQAEAQRFNIDRAGWVYKIDKGVYEKLLKKSNYFVDR